jgi:hypothetical protein
LIPDFGRRHPQIAEILLHQIGLAILLDFGTAIKEPEGTGAA